MCAINNRLVSLTPKECTEMPTKKPRITITLQPENYALLKAVSEAQHATPSVLLNELISELTPALNNMLTLIAAAKNAPKEVVTQYANLMNIEADRAKDYLKTNEKQTDWLVDAIGKDAVQPPYINKGVRSKSEGKKSSNRKASVVSGHFSKKVAK